MFRTLLPADVQTLGLRLRRGIPRRVRIRTALVHTVPNGMQIQQIGRDPAGTGGA